jgi:SAM-dependent methyltransferase
VTETVPTAPPNVPGLEPFRVLHLGCGRERDLGRYGVLAQPHWAVTHLDQDPLLQPDLVCQLGRDRIVRKNAKTQRIERPEDMLTDTFDLAVAWHVLEHIGKQGEKERWFQFWEELYRVLKPGAALVFESPYYTSIWAWSDPTHTRALSEHSFIFFNQDSYRIPGSMISPYRIACDFQWGLMPGMPKGWALIPDPTNPGSGNLRGCLVARKPLTPWWSD